MAYHLSKKFHLYARRLLGTKLWLPDDPAQWPEEWKTVTYKNYDRFERIKLPAPAAPTSSLAQAISARGSHREYAATEPLSLEKLSTILHGAGIRTPQAPLKYALRFYPSGGGRFPLEVYVATRGNNELPGGIYHYHVPTHSLEKIAGAEGFEAVRGTLTYRFALEAPMVLILTSVWERNFIKYKDFGYAITLLEAGHLSQNLLLLAAALGVKSCPLAGFLIDAVAEALGVDPAEEAPLHTILLGEPEASG